MRKLQLYWDYYVISHFTAVSLMQIVNIAHELWLFSSLSQAHLMKGDPHYKCVTDRTPLLKYVKRALDFFHTL